MRTPTPFRKIGISLIAGLAFMSAPLAAQSIESVDPSQAIDGDLIEQPGEQPVYAEAVAAGTAAVAAGTAAVDSAQDSVQDMATGMANDATSAVDSWSVQETAGSVEASDYGSVADWADPGVAGVSNAPVDVANINMSGQGVNQATTFKEDDLIGAAEGVFGKGAKGVAKLIQDLLSKQGEPNGYIVGREAGGAFFVGARYGSGTLYHKVEGQRPVYWTGPSIGFDMGANVGNTFVLVYNLHDSEELYARFPAGEGQAYVVGGMTASYMRKGNKVLIPIRVGAGLRLGVNAGYMKFSKKQRWLPF